MQYRIALVGRSLGVSSIGASLATRPEFELVRFGGNLTDVARWIDAVAPDVVIFDIAGASECPVIGPLRHPGRLLIGCDLLSHHMVIVSGEQVDLSTTEDLLRVFARHHLCGEAAGN